MSRHVYGFFVSSLHFIFASTYSFHLSLSLFRSFAVFTHSFIFFFTSCVALHMNLADRTEIEFLFPTPNLKKKKSIQKMLVKLSAGLNVFFSSFVTKNQNRQTKQCKRRLNLLATKQRSSHKALVSVSGRETD